MALDVSPRPSDRGVVLEPGENEPMKRRGTPNELMPRATSRCHRDQLVERLEALHTSIPNAEEPMAKTAFDHSCKRRRSTPCPRPIVDAREPPSTLLGGSPPQPAMWL